jgi:hypothetical protein
MFNFLCKLAWATFFLAGAGAFYIATPAAIHSVDNVEILEKNGATLKTDWNLTREFINEHPYLSRVALQLSETRAAYQRGYSRRVVYQHQWALSDAQVQMLTVPDKSTTTKVTWRCDQGHPSVSIHSQKVGIAAPDDSGSSILAELTISSAHENVTTQAVYRNPWWYPTVFTVGGETANRRKEIAQALPELDKGCAGESTSPSTPASA